LTHLDTPEKQARQRIDAALMEAGWQVQSRNAVNLHAGRGVAVREFRLKPGHGYADYLLYLEGQAAGVIEAKKEGETLTGVEVQAEKYAAGLPEALPAPHLQSTNAPLNAVARSYVVEALDCYVDGLFKAGAVMVGTAAEAIILELRDVAVGQLRARGNTVPHELEKWQIKTVTDGLGRLFQQIDRKKYRQLVEKFDAHWGALTHEIRTTRNDAGHPTSVDPVTPESVHASLLLFPVLVNLCDELMDWCATEL
jgi:hypothetical protein